MSNVAAHETPMMRQYLEVKASQPGCLLLMRMGDFFEAFLEDAVELSRITGVALTSRNKDADQPIAMAGVPHHSLPGYLPKLLAAGKRVAIMDQLEDPKEAKGLVKRGLTRVITAGTLIDESGIDASSANWLVAVTGFDGLVGIAALDVSTGRFTVEEADASRLALSLARLQPAELVVPDELKQADGTAQRLAVLCAPNPVPPLSSVPAFAWKGGDARRYLNDRLRVVGLEGFGIASGEDHLAAAAAAALRYADSSTSPGSGTEQRNALGHIRTITRLHQTEHLIIDATCRRNLDLLRNSRDGTRAGTLLATVDRTATAPGARLLADWLSRPLATIGAINARHDAVAYLVAHDQVREDVRESLAKVYDIERLLARVATGRCNARDLVHLAQSLRAALRVQEALAHPDGTVGVPQLLAAARVDLAPDAALAEEITRILVDDPPLTTGDGGMVRNGVDPDLDQLRSIKQDASAWLAAYQAREAENCGLTKLKVGYNRVFGYYIEISKANGDKVPAHFIRKQTLVGAERYITPELKEYEDRALGAEDRIRSAELAIFSRLRERTEGAVPVLQHCADALSLCDVAAALAEVARKRGWCRPTVDGSRVLTLHECRHPVVEEVIGRGRFVANDTALDAGAIDDQGSDTSGSPARLAVITGPNMAGKSTYIRQVALAVVLAQAGSFVPARAAHVGVVDRVFTRVGAGDELARNLSTFMVEMAETAAILNHATRRSLVILDEVGRGTSTFDGVSLAWAITEHIHDRIGCRCLFATHYHELVDLAADRPGICNLTVSVAEQDDDVVFLHRIVPGAATKSYGIHVARLAGVPQPVIARAREVLATLEQLNVSLTERERPAVRHAEASGRPAPIQLTLFSAVESQTVQRLKSLGLDELTPRQALDLLYSLQASARQE